MLTYAAHDGRVEQDFAAARLQGCPLQRGDDVTHMEVDHILQLVGRAVQQAC